MQKIKNTTGVRKATKELLKTGIKDLVSGKNKGLRGEAVNENEV